MRQSESKDFNTGVMMEAVAKLHSAHMKFAKLQPKQPPNKDNGGPSFSPTLVLSQPNNEASLLATMFMADASISMDRKSSMRMY